MSTDPTVNPYAPPAEDDGRDDDDDHRPRRRKRGVDFTPERRSIAVTVLLSVVTIGIYNVVWLWRRRAFIDSFDTIQRDKLGRIPELAAGFLAASTLMTVIGGAATPLSGPLSLAHGITALIGGFTVGRALRSEIARTGRLIEVSSLLIFFFGIWYLQYKLNEISDTPIRKRKKRTKKVELAEERVDEEESG